MNFEEFEYQAEQKLNSHHSEIDAEALWSDLEPVLQKKRKRRAFFWIPLFFGMIVLSYTLWQSPFFTAQNAKLKSIESTAIQIDQKLETSENFQESVASKKKEKKPEGEKLGKNGPTKVSRKLAFLNGSADPKNGNEQKENFTLKKTISKLQKTPQHKQSNPLKTNIREEKQSTRNIKLIKPLPLKDIAALSASDYQLPTDYGSIDIKKNTKLKWGIGINAGGGINAQTLTSRDSDKDFLAQRKDSETELEDLNLGLDIKVINPKGLSLSTGLNFTRVAGKFEIHSEKLKLLPRENSLQATYISLANQDTTYAYGTVYDRETTSIQKTKYNYTYLLDIPVLIGYTKRAYPWFLGVEGGPLLNVYLDRRGEIWDTQNDYYDLKKEEEDWFKDRLSLSLYLGASIGYYLSEHWQLSLNPGYRFPVEWSSTKNPLRQKYSSVGLRVGLRYWW